MDEHEKQIRQRLKNDFPHYAKRCLKIRSKAGNIYPLELNKAQLYIHSLVEEQKAKTGKVRAIVLKGRQQGCSTYIEGRFYWLSTHRFGVRAFILTHDSEATSNLFDMAKRYHDKCPGSVQPSIQASNAKELIFSGLDSGYKVGTAGNKSVGRSSTIQLLHGSEVAYWQHASEHAKGVLQAVSGEAGTEIFFESTANGVGNYFHQQWQLAESGQSDFIPIFVPWFWQDEYQRSVPNDFKLTNEEQELVDLYQLTHEQLSWRRYKIVELSVDGKDGEKSFKQEYPNNAIEAFETTGEDSFIHPDLVIKARKNQCEAYGPLLIGVDPARFGDDRSSIIRRQGRKVFGLKSHSKIDTMELAGIVHLIIEKEKPAKVFVDVCGLGAGVFDRLKELGHAKVIVAVNSAEKAINNKRFANKRAEIWGETKDWLIDGPVELPDVNSLHADLCAPKYKVDSKGRTLIEPKDEIKKRGIRSPDEADALCLTFALPHSVYLANSTHKSEEIAARVMSQASTIAQLRDMQNGNR